MIQQNNRTIRDTITLYHQSRRHIGQVFAALALNTLLLVPIAACSLNAAEPPTRPAGTEADSKLVPLNPEQTVLLDKGAGKLVLKGTVCLREGLLEMLVCLRGTKEHESLLAVQGKAQTVHAGLLALGAEVGTPVEFTPTYRAATGQSIGVWLAWTDESGKPQRVPASTWVRNATRKYYVRKLKQLPADLTLTEDIPLRWDDKHSELLWFGPMTTKQLAELTALSTDAEYRAAIKSMHDDGQPRELKFPWVFAGSRFVTDSESGEVFYQAEGGDLICVANFATATLDLAVESTAANDDLLYEAFTDRVPPLGTLVDIELVPVKAMAK
jgi:hypothetical protein